MNQTITNKIDGSGQELMNGCTSTGTVMPAKCSITRMMPPPPTSVPRASIATSMMNGCQPECPCDPSSISPPMLMSALEMTPTPFMIQLMAVLNASMAGPAGTVYKPARPELHS